MANYRRWRVAGGTFFFTLVARNRAPLFSDPIAKRILGQKIRQCRRETPFEIDALVLLPDHLHTIWTLPSGDTAYSMRWGWIKKEFTKDWLSLGGYEQSLSESRRLRGDRGIWQPRYWEHTIENEHDFDRHFDYIHYNPVKHSYATCPGDWRESSLHRWVRAGVYDKDWGCASRGPLLFDDLNQTAMEI